MRRRKPKSSRIKNVAIFLYKDRPIWERAIKLLEDAGFVPIAEGSMGYIEICVRVESHESAYHILHSDEIVKQHIQHPFVFGKRMSEKEIRLMVEGAFADTPAPGDAFDDISATMDDEGIVDYFRNTTWGGHSVQNLRRNAAALSFFTDKAFRYWLPAFMLAELENPEEADIIAEGVAFHLTDANGADARLRQFSKDELKAITAFLNHCVERYDSEEFQQAARVVETQMQEE